MIIFLVLAGVVIFIYQWFVKIVNMVSFLRQIANIPGPKGHALIGNALEFTSPAAILPNLSKYKKEYGPIFKLWFGPDAYVFTADPRLIEIITTSNTQITKSVTYKVLREWIGDGLLGATNPRWRIHRRLITPAFHFNILKDFVPTFHKNADNLIEHWKRAIYPNKKKEIDVYEDILACALDTICETAMGISINALRDGQGSNYLEAVKFMKINIMDRTFNWWMQFDFLYKMSGKYKKQIEMMARIRKTTEDVIKQKHEEMNNQNLRNSSAVDDFGTKKRVAFLDLLMTTVKESGGRFTDVELREEVDTFIFAGHDTTTSAASFALYCLAKHPEIQERVYEEIITELDGNEYMSYENINNLKYMEQVIKESLRLFPTAPIFLRRLSEDINYNGYVLPKGVNVGIFVYGVQRLESVYENPEKFDPDRFTQENSRQRDAFAYIPFSAGPRNCIGQKYALLEIKCLLSSLLKTFKFSKSNIFDVRLSTEAVLKSENGVKLIVQTRQTH